MSERYAIRDKANAFVAILLAMLLLASPGVVIGGVVAIELAAADRSE